MPPATTAAAVAGHPKNFPVTFSGEVQNGSSSPDLFDAPCHSPPLATTATPLSPPPPAVTTNTILTSPP
ncbi:hypothetical protein Tco_1369154 [Tanacetum coccineum]